MFPSKRQWRILKLAQNVANQSCAHQHKHGAVLVRGGNIINTAFNVFSVSAFAARFRDPSLGLATRHAELNLILGIDRQLTDGATVYVVRTNKSGYLKMSMPCEMCQDAMEFVGVRRCFYTVSNNEIEEIRF